MNWVRMLACLHNPSKQAKSPVLEERAGAEHKKKKNSLYSKSKCVAQNDYRSVKNSSNLFLKKPYVKDAVPAVKKISSSRGNGTSVYFFIFLISNFLTKFSKKLEKLVKCTLEKQNFPEFSQFICQTKNSEILPEKKNTRYGTFP